MNQPHDSAYKRLFSHREPVEDLLRGYVATDWLDLLDLATLETAPTEHISEASHKRTNDIIWRVRWRQGDTEDWLYIYLLLEFQSTICDEMALRLAEYLALFYRDLVKSGTVTGGRQLRLPPIVPVVLYNGSDPWWPATDLAQLIHGPESLAHLQLRVRYLLLDETRMQTSPLAEERNLAALLFRLEQSRDPETIEEISRYDDKGPYGRTIRAHVA